MVIYLYIILKMHHTIHTVNENIKFTVINNILYAQYSTCIINEELAKKIVKERKEFTKNISLPAVITCVGRVEITKEARKYFATLKGTIGLTHIALVYENSTTNKLLMNFMIKMHPPIVPTKIFKNKEKAISWIKRKTSIL